MSEEIKRLLIGLADLPSMHDQNGVSIAYLSGRLGMERQRLLKAIELLEQVKYVQVKQVGRVNLVTPTLLGYEKAADWKKELDSKSWFGRMPGFLKLVAGSLVAAAVGLVLYLLNLSPQTISLQPLASSIPIRMYQVHTWPPTEWIPSGAWFQFSKAPQPGQIVPIGSQEEYDRLLKEWFPEYIPVTLDGLLSFQFDIESVAVGYQVNIDSILIEVESGPIHDPEDVYFFAPGLGGGDIRQYELDLGSQPTNPARSDIQTYKAVLKSEGKAVDYIYLKPGERESFEISVNLGKPGSYKMTPVVSYVFRDKPYSLKAKTYRVVYPKRYRTWGESDAGCPSQQCPSGFRPIMTHNILVDTRSGRVEVPGSPVSIGSACLLSQKWIAFESTMITYGSLNRLFAITSNGNELREIRSSDLHRVRRNLRWTSDGRLVVGEPFWDERLSKFVQEAYQIDLSSGASNIISATLPAVQFDYDRAWNSVCLRNGEGCFVVDSSVDTNGDGRIDSQDPKQIYLERNKILTRLGFSPENQMYLSLSPENTWLAFVQEKVSKSCSEGTGLYVMRTDGSSLRKLSSMPGWYGESAWSPDGRYLAFEASRKTDSSGHLVCDGNIYHIYVLDLQTGREIQLTKGILNDYEPQWSTDGAWVIAGGDRLSLNRSDGSCGQDVFVPPVGEILNVTMQP